MTSKQGKHTPEDGTAANLAKYLKRATGDVQYAMKYAAKYDLRDDAMERLGKVKDELVSLQKFLGVYGDGSQLDTKEG